LSLAIGESIRAELDLAEPQERRKCRVDFEKTIEQLKQAVADIVQIDKDQNEVLKKHNQRVGELEQFRHRTEQNLAEITDKLNGLIGYVGGWKPPQRP